MFSFAELSALDNTERFATGTQLEYCKLCDTEFFSDRARKLNCCASCYQELQQVKRYVDGKPISRSKLANIVSSRSRTIR